MANEIDHIKLDGTTYELQDAGARQDIINIENDIDDIQEEIIDVIAQLYNSTETYSVGNYCIHDANLYRCTTAITVPEAWTPAHWELTNVAESMEHSTEDDVDYIIGR